jgi:hypothetical protein
MAVGDGIERSGKERGAWHRCGLARAQTNRKAGHRQIGIACRTRQSIGHGRWTSEIHSYFQMFVRIHKIVMDIKEPLSPMGNTKVTGTRNQKH